MKNTALFLVVFNTVFLFVLMIMSRLPVNFYWIFYLTMIGQALVVLMVYKVLRDTYTTDKTFEDFYEDYPIGRRGIDEDSIE